MYRVANRCRLGSPWDLVVHFPAKSAGTDAFKRVGIQPLLSGVSHVTLKFCSSYYFTIGWKQVWLACKEIRHLPQTFTYLSASFLLADGLNTTGTLISIIQNQVVSFSLLDITYYGLAQAVCSIFSTFGFWYIQRYFEMYIRNPFLSVSTADWI